MSIWQNKILINQFSQGTNLITMDEGDTRVDSVRDGDKELFIKREDKNPTGSWKDRGTAYKLTSLLSQNINEAVLFSSGNALISLLKYCRELNLQFKIHAVVSRKINDRKLELIQSLVSGSEHELIISDTPKKEAIRISAQENIPNLRISIDNEIVKGYWTLGFEIFKLIKNYNNQDVSIFCPASSGTALVGMSEGLLMESGSEFKMPKVFVCQTERVHPFAQLNSSIVQQSNSYADAIVDTVGLRSSQVQKITRETGGEVYAITNDELEAAKAFVESKGIGELSYNSLLSIAGYLKNPSKINVCIASGR